MFTGIIDHVGVIHQINPITQGLTLGIKHSFSNLVLGESIAIDGICLTVTHFDDHIFHCDISPETLKKTTANHFQPGKKVNLERALLPTTRMGGHFVSGHVDQTAQIKKINPVKEFIELQISLPSNKRKWVIKKGSIAINGVSLTINEVNESVFSVMLIPHTLERTNLITLNEQDEVNIEFDMLAKMVAHQLENIKS